MCYSNEGRNNATNYRGSIAAFHEYMGFVMIRRLLILLSEISGNPEEIQLCLFVIQLLQLVYLDLFEEYQEMQSYYGPSNYYNDLAQAQQSTEQQGQVQSSTTEENVPQSEKTDKEDNKDENKKNRKNKKQGKKRKLQQDDIENDDWKKACNKYWKDKDDEYDRGGPSNGSFGQILVSN